MGNPHAQRKHLDPETGIMTITIDDKPILVKVAQQDKGSGPTKTLQRSCKQQLVRTPTPSGPSKQARPWQLWSWQRET